MTSPVQESYTFRIIETFEQWRALKNTWNNLLTRSRANTVFLTWEWLYSWAECYLSPQRRLFIITVYEGDELIGVAPWYINRKESGIFKMNYIEFLGTPEAGSDYLDVFTKSGKEKTVTNLLYDFLFQRVRSRWDYLMLRDIPCHSLFFLHFVNAIHEHGKYAEINNGSYCPTIHLPETEELFFHKLSPRRREQFRRHLRILEREDGVQHRSVYGSGIESAVNDFFMIPNQKKKNEFELLQKFMKKFCSLCNDKDWIQIDFLTARGNNIAGLLHFRYQGSLHMYSMLIDKSFNPKISVGNVLLGLSILQAVQTRMRSYDMLKGLEAYKFHWANDGEASLNILFCQKKTLPVLFMMGRFIKYTAKVILR